MSDDIQFRRAEIPYTPPAYVPVTGPLTPAAVLYGVAAALVGLVVTALVEIAAHLQLGLIAYFVGIGVGRAVRAGSNGYGGRPQQILAVALVYLATSLSSVAVLAWHYRGETLPVGRLFLYGIASPFLELFQSPASGVLSLIILFVGMQRAWTLTRA